MMRTIASESETVFVRDRTIDRLGLKGFQKSQGDVLTVPMDKIVLGLVGTFCAGKSCVACHLRRCGADVWDADEVVRGLYEQADVKCEVHKLLGGGVFDAAGNVDRQAIASRVFGPGGDGDLRRLLTGNIVFPRTGRLLRKRIDEFHRGVVQKNVLVVDAPTLFESGRTGWCDVILMVTASTEKRKIRAVAKGWSAVDVDRRDAAMVPESEKRRGVDFVIENEGTLKELEAFGDRFWGQLFLGDRTKDP